MQGILVIGTHTENLTDTECREYRYMVVGTVSLVQKGHHIGNGAHEGKSRENWWWEPMQRIGPMQRMQET